MILSVAGARRGVRACPARAVFFALLAVAIAVCLCVALSAAPAPVYRAKPVPEVTPGRYVFRWGSTACDMDLKADGTLSYRWNSWSYRGTWQWEKATRTLHVHETINGYDWCDWKATLDEKLSGKGVMGNIQAAVSLTPAAQKRLAGEAPEGAPPALAGVPD